MFESTYAVLISLLAPSSQMHLIQCTNTTSGRPSVMHIFLMLISDELKYSDHSTFRSSQWFTRGWTLQELIALLLPTSPFSIFLSSIAYDVLSLSMWVGLCKIGSVSTSYLKYLGCKRVEQGLTIP